MDHVEELTRRVVERAGHEGLVDVAYATVDSPVGPLVAAATEAGVVHVSYRGEERALEELAHKVSPRVLRLPSRLEPVRRQLDEYFAGTRRAFDTPIDWQLTAGFTRRVLEATFALPYGHVATYAQVAAAAGNPKAMRAAGNALSSNPIPIIVPCHRVVKSDGTIGGYTGGLDKKLVLLGVEGVTLG